MGFTKHGRNARQRLFRIWTLVLVGLVALACAPKSRPPAPVPGPSATSVHDSDRATSTLPPGQGQVEEAAVTPGASPTATPVPPLPSAPGRWPTSTMLPAASPSVSVGWAATDTPTAAAPLRSSPASLATVAGAATPETERAISPTPPGMPAFTPPPGPGPTARPSAGGGTATPAATARPDAGAAPRASAAVGPAAGFAWSPDGKLLAVACDQGLLFLDGQTLAGLSTLPPTGPSSAVAFSYDGSRLATATLSNTVQIWDVGRGKLLRTLDPPAAGVARPAFPKRIVDVAFSPDGALLSAAVLGYYEGGQGSLWTWDTANGMDRRLVASYGPPARLAYRPGTLIVALARGVDSCARGGGGVALWDLAITQELRVLSNSGEGVSDVNISPDGSWLAAATGTTENGRCIGPGIVQLWDIASGQARGRLVDAGSAGAVAISADGARLAAGYVEGYVMVWEPAGGGRLATLAGGAERVVRVAFSPSGTALAALSRDGMLRLWDLD